MVLFENIFSKGTGTGNSGKIARPYQKDIIQQTIENIKYNTEQSVVIAGSVGLGKTSIV
ncbi:MAG: hypothetical protein ACOC1K_04580 [Nanoarchaeota archaeon]